MVAARFQLWTSRVIGRVFSNRMSDGAMLMREGYGHMTLATCLFLSKVGDRYIEIQHRTRSTLYISNFPITLPYMKKVTGYESL